MTWPMTGAPVPGPPPARPPHVQPEGAPRRALLLVVLILGITMLVGTLVVAAGPVGGLGGGRVSATASATRSAASSGVAPAEAAEVTIIGADPADPVTKVVQAAIAEVGSFWTTTYPEQFGPGYRPVRSFRAVQPAVDGGVCGVGAEMLSGNALYCTEDQSIAYDTVGLFPELIDKYGELSVAFVMAHEWAHHVQAVSGRPPRDAAVVTYELQADCYAGSWLASARAGGSYFAVDDSSLDRAVAGIVKQFKDPVGTDPDDPSVLPHGNAFDRVDAVLDGYRNGAASCAGYTESEVRSRLTLTPFVSMDDLLNEGNLPADETLDFTKRTLDEFWNTEGVEALGRTTVPLDVRATTGAAPACSDAVATDPDAVFCPGDGAVVVRTDGEPTTLYRSFGDYAVSTYVAHAYALGELERRGGLERLDTRERTLIGDCLTGAYTAWLFDPAAQRESGSLSPGDLDEAVGVLLTTGGEAAPPGFERVESFRQGFRSGIGGTDGCRLPS